MAGEPIARDDGTIDPTRSRYKIEAKPECSKSSLGHGKPWTRGDDDGAEESISVTDKEPENQMGVIEFRYKGDASQKDIWKVIRLPGSRSNRPFVAR